MIERAAPIVPLTIKGFPLVEIEAIKPPKNIMHLPVSNSSGGGALLKKSA